MNKPIYLYVKTHRKTGLKYLGKTAQDPFTYKGSGIHWRRHIKQHGYDVDTEIIKECVNNDEVKHWGVYYSILWDVANSSSWANLKDEQGDGGHPGLDAVKKISEARKNRAPWNKGIKTGIAPANKGIKGVVKHVRSAEYLEKQRIAQTGLSKGKGRVSNRKGIVMSQEQKDKIRATLLKRYNKDEQTR